MAFWMVSAWVADQTYLCRPVFLPGQFAILVGVSFVGKIFILPCPALILVLIGSLGQRGCGGILTDLGNESQLLS